MNFLAHLFLSGNNDEIMVGNLLGDFMKGRKISNFDDGIVKGILLHRKIDEFTDNHALVLQTKERLRPLFNHYTPVVADVFYDHILAVNWSDYSDVALKDFAKHCYQVMRKHKDLFPLRFQPALVYMRFRNVLMSYAKFSGIDFAFNRVASRSLYPSNLQNATTELKKNHKLYTAEFKEFFPQLQEYVEMNL
jgi:acyl carrier protein phosphodiesterase